MKKIIKIILDYNLHPLEKVILSFIILIFFGTILLLLPLSTAKGIRIIDAFFTSTSAVCVTGLTVLNTSEDFTIFGRFVILLLIQFGGFGIMTFSLGLLSLFGKELSIKWRYAIKGIYTDTGQIPIRSILIRVIKYTFIIESITAVILFTQFYKEFQFSKAIEHSVFHAISAFCNAGFSTFSNNLVQYQNNYIVSLTISSAIVLGGLGFVVLNEISRLRSIKIKKTNKYNFLSMHTKLILITTIILIFTGMFGFAFLEWNYSLNHKNIAESLLISFFQSITCRTAGFNTIEIVHLRESTHFIMIFLMFIGGSPGSIAGGVKTTTIAVIFLLIYSKFKGENEVTVFGRSLDHETVDRSTTLVILSIIFVSFITFLMLAIREFDIDHSFISVLFETISAFGTVGLSMGITNQLPDVEKIILAFVMFIGRLGPLTLIMVLTIKKKRDYKKYPREHIMIG